MNNEYNTQNGIDYNEPHDPFDDMLDLNHDYSNIMVHLDAGHASSTPGKGSPYSLNKVLPALDFKEYLFNREIVNMLSEKLTMYGFKVNIVTPEIDKDIKLSTRAERANKKKEENPNLNHILISVHANATGDGTSWTSAHGWSAYTTKGNNNSDKLADCLYDAAEKILPDYDISIRTDKSDGDRDYEENFTIIYMAKMPAVLTENCFYTNINDTKFLLSEQGKCAIVDIHFKGIIDFVNKMYK